MLVLFEDELDQCMILAKNENITNAIDIGLTSARATRSAVDISKRRNNFTYLPYDTNKYNASGERSFSVLKRMKSIHKNVIDQEQLDSLTLLCIESAERKKAGASIPPKAIMH